MMKAWRAYNLFLKKGTLIGQKVNSQLVLHVADKVVTKFLEDSAVETKIEESNTAHNFFSNQVYGNDMLKIIDRKIGQETEEISFIKKTIFGI